MAVLARASCRKRETEKKIRLPFPVNSANFSLCAALAQIQLIFLAGAQPTGSYYESRG